MMFKAVARVALSLIFSASVCLTGSVAAQSTPQDAPSPQPAAQSTAEPSTLGSSTSLNSSSNDLASLYGTPVVQIVARVNDRVITNDDITRAKNQLAQDSRQQNWSLEQYNHAEKNLLRDLIDQQLLLSKGKQLGITGDTELIKRLDDIRKENHLSTMDDLEKAVEQQGTSYEDFKANIRNSIITQEVVRDEVGSKLQISQMDVEKYYKEHEDSFTQPESIHLNEILIPTNDNPTNDQLNAAEAKANEVEEKLKAGGNFADLAKKYSGGPTAQEGGDLGEFKRGSLAKVLEDQTFDLPVGGYTKPIRTRQGYIILQVTKHNPGGTQPLQKVEPQIEQALYMERIAPAVRKYLTRLREEAYIDIRPGFTDAGASSNESKPTYTAYVPPQPKKKKKKKRFDRRLTRYTRGSTKKAAPVAVAANAAPAAVSAGTTAAATAGSAAAGSATTASTPSVSSSAKAQNSGRLSRVFGKKKTTHKSKRVKLRYGQAPATPVSEEQVATAPTQANPPPAATTAPDVQPLGPDLEHNPVIEQPKETKTRYSDLARNKSARPKTKHHAKKVKKVKVDTAKPSALTPTEQANQKVESAPLGLSGDTTKKKKKQKVKVKGGEKTRMSDQKKKSAQSSESNSGSGGTQSGSSDASSQPQ